MQLATATHSKPKGRRNRLFRYSESPEFVPKRTGGFLEDAQAIAAPKAVQGTAGGAGENLTDSHSTDRTCDSVGKARPQTKVVSPGHPAPVLLNQPRKVFCPGPDFIGKFKTELCKNFQMTSHCVWGDGVG